MNFASHPHRTEETKNQFVVALHYLKKKIMAVQKVIPELSPPEEIRGDLPYGKTITVVLAGKREFGKSTLINKLLRLSKENEADTGMGTDPTTKEVTVYSEKVDGIELRVVDIPGLGVQGQSDDERHDIMADIIAKTNKEADILLYCASMSYGWPYR